MLLPICFLSHKIIYYKTPRNPSRLSFRLSYASQFFSPFLWLVPLFHLHSMCFTMIWNLLFVHATFDSDTGIKIAMVFWYAQHVDISEHFRKRYESFPESYEMLIRESRMLMKPSWHFASRRQPPPIDNFSSKLCNHDIPILSPV